jgi:two-component system chemotaxis response regulator CheB
MSIPRIVVVGASSGGVEALRTLVKTLPADFPAPICIVMHVAPTAPDVMPEILSRAGELEAVSAVTGMRIESGLIYLAPPDHHLLIEPGRLRVTKGPKENRSRPAVDPLFQSAASVYGPAAIGVILTGDLDDGTAGLWTLKRLGGIAIVEDPTHALYPSMPASAQRHVEVDFVQPLEAIGPLLAELVTNDDVRARMATPESVEIEMNIANGSNAIDVGVERLGEPSSFACPECHGVLLKIKEEYGLRFRCHTGHAYSVESLIAAIDDAIEDAVWNAARALEEKGLLFDQLAAAIETRDSGSAASLRSRGREVRRQSERIRQVTFERQSDKEVLR